METSSAYVTGSQIQPIVDGLTAQVGEFLPILLPIFGLFLAVKMVPKLIAKFAK